MAKQKEAPWVFRSLLFVPGHIDKFVQKALGSNADTVVLDLEDAVPEVYKADARNHIRSILDSGACDDKTTFIRINPLETGLTLLDLDAVATDALDGFVYPMAYTANDIRNFDAQLRLKEISLGLPVGHFSLIVLIETALGVLNAYEIAKASDRIVGLLFGCEDYLAGMEARHSPNDMSLHAPRAQVTLAARAAGIEPIDTPYVKVHDLDGLREFATRARDLGMAGMLTMSPKQIAIAHEVYSPTAEEVAYAKKVVDAAVDAEKEGRGIVIVDEAFVSPPTVKAAHRLLNRHNAIQQLEQ